MAKKIKLKYFTDERGTLTVLDKEIKFKIKRAYFIHNAKGQQTRNGVFLLSKHKPITQKEIEHRHLVDAKHWDIEASQECIYNMFLVETYNDYLDAMENSDTEMFWGYSNNIDFSEFDESEYYFSHDNFYDRNINHTFVNFIAYACSNNF